MSITTFAAIYVGSYEVSLKIMEISAKRGVREVDHIRSRMEIGKNIYQSQRVDTEIMEQLCEVLCEYDGILKSYRVDDYRAYAGAFLRRAENVLFLLEQVHFRTGIQVQILSNSERRFLSYQTVAAKPEFEEMIQEGAIVVDIGGESIQVTLFVDGAVATTQHMTLGTMRIREMLKSIGNAVIHFEAQMEELVNKDMEVLKAMYLKKSNAKYLILIGDYSRELAQNLPKHEDGITVNASALADYLNGLATLDADEIAQKLDLPGSDPLLLPFIVLYRCMAQGLGAEKVWVPGNRINDGIAYQYAREKKLLKYSHDFDKDVLSAATNLSKRYRSYSSHIDALRNMSTLIFDTMKKVHGLGKREKLLLQVAAILHDCGKYVSLFNSSDCSYNIIMSSEIIGLTHMEREIVASTVRYNTKPLDAYEDVADKMDMESYMVAAKLAAILRVANALDRSHKQKFRTIRLTLKKEELLITVETDDDIALEKGLLASKSDRFESIFGIKPVLREKRSF